MKDASQASSLGLDPKMAALIGYIPIVNLIFFLIEKSSKFVKFHAAQSLCLTVCSIALNIVCGILGLIPGIGGLFSMVGTVGSLILFAAAIFCAIKAYGLEWFELPIVGEFAMKQIGD